MVITAFFTIWWPVFLLLLVPVLATTGALIPVAFGKSGGRSLQAHSLSRRSSVQFRGRHSRSCSCR